MTVEVLVEEPVQVLLRTLPAGRLAPTSFVWRGKTRYVSDIGRQWEERVAGQALRCFLIRAVDGGTYELRWDPTGDAWTLYRAWLSAQAV